MTRCNICDGNPIAMRHCMACDGSGEMRAGWESETGGQKFDQDKPRMDLLDPYAMEELAKVLTFGARKYAPDNWRKGINYGRLTAAALRHIFAFMSGEDKDPETGLPHPAHAMCCMMFLVWTMEKRADLDDRHKVTDPLPPTSS